MPTISGVLPFDALLATSGNWDHREPGIALSQRGDSVWARQAKGSLNRPDAGLVMTWDGRLDNAGDLLLRLGGGTHSRTDGEIVLAAVERWGVPALEWLVGEWSLALWDRALRALRLARDYMGARPLYYCMDAHGVAWSSDLAELVDRCERRDALSDAFAARFMSVRPLPALTPYEGVHAVPPGVCVTFSATGTSTATRLWRMEPGQIRYADRRKYEEQLRALWHDAVGARLRTDGPVWAELSGGLDSSSVVCTADRLIRAGGVRAAALRLVSHATLHAPEGDERRFIAEVERQVGMTSEIVGVEDSHGGIDPERAWVTPYALQGVGLETVRRVRSCGGRLILSGRLGDAIMGCQPDNSEAVFDDLAVWDLLAALRKLRAWSRATRKPIVELAWTLVGPDRAMADPGTALLTPRLRTIVLDTPGFEDLNGIRRSKRTLAHLVLGYALGGRLQIPAHSPDIVYAYPFAHRPLVEFVLAIPGEELSAPGLMRSLMRRSFSGLLPPRILNRVSKGYYPPAAFRAARRQAASITDVDRLDVVARGWIDPDRLRQALRTLRDGGGATGGDVHRVLRLERWLQARRDRPAIPQRKEVNSHEVLNA